MAIGEVTPVGVVGLTREHHEELQKDALAYRKLKPELDNYKKLKGAIEALGVIGNSYCFCSGNRLDDDTSWHEPECQNICKALEALK
jgi:hypothetical protein